MPRNHCLLQGSLLSVLVFQLFIYDIPLGEEDLIFMDDCALFAVAKNLKSL